MKEQSTPKAVFATIFFLIGAAVVLWAGIGSLRQVINRARAAGWPTVEGQVVSSQVKPGGRGGPAYPDVRYRYRIKGVAYVSTGLTFGTIFESKAAATETVESLPVGAAIRVHYDPSAPAISAAVVERISDYTFGWFVFSFFVMLFDAVVVYAAFLMARSAVLRLYGRSRGGRGT